MSTAIVRYGDNYTDIEFPCSDSYLRSKLLHRASKITEQIIRCYFTLYIVNSSLYLRRLY